MKILAISLMLGFICIFWYLISIFHKPKLNKMYNYYEEDVEGSIIANFLIFFIICLSFLIGNIID